MPEFYRLIQTDPTVHALYRCWMNGEFASFEAALVAMVCALAKQKEVIAENLGKEPPPVIFRKLN